MIHVRNRRIGSNHYTCDDILLTYWEPWDRIAPIVTHGVRCEYLLQKIRKNPNWTPRRPCCCGLANGCCEPIDVDLQYTCESLCEDDDSTIQMSGRSAGIEVEECSIVQQSWSYKFGGLPLAIGDSRIVSSLCSDEIFFCFIFFILQSMVDREGLLSGQVVKEWGVIHLLSVGWKRQRHSRIRG